MENASQLQLSSQDVSNSSHKLEDGIWCGVFATEAVVIVIGNLLIVVVFARDARLRKQSCYLLISLALADLLIGLITVPMWIYQVGLGSLWHSKLTDHELIISSFSGLDIFTSLASISNLAAISLERLYATLLPWRHRATSKLQCLLFILVVWMLSALSSVMYILSLFVLLSTHGALYSWLPYLCLLLLVICASYTAILVKVRRGNNRRLDSERKFTMTLFMVTVFSLVAYLPMVALGVLYFALGIEVSNLFLRVLSLFNFGNSLVNPILYSFRMPDFRKAVRLLFCTHHQRQQTRRMRSHLTIPPVDGGVSPSSSYRMTAISPTMMSPSSFVSRVPNDDDDLRAERQNQGLWVPEGSPRFEIQPRPQPLTQS